MPLISALVFACGAYLTLNGLGVDLSIEALIGIASIAFWLGALAGTAVE